MSKDPQNKLIEIISTEIVNTIAGMIDDCAAWALMADTTPDVIKHEQLSLCVRIVSKHGKVNEHLLFMVRVEATTASDVSKISDELKKRNIDFSDLIAQTYDGASDMSGRYNGLQAKLKRSRVSMLSSLIVTAIH